ncbi:sugar ABC transporter permease [Alicyclobacillus macrosporangiidus]|uniref:Xylose transport system permease protein XylH n=1 Tax=Alicyclobacillus macrosporangiidus TaxID=392015 RepID=A0A1I7GIZ1_9BACL|nr:ABC transporter permease [Alicyclobacillus macrosporangiidus]SFU48389.1 D-xylose transport system permease protein [Alicyclobacillus macrosporangiidus]
MNPTANPPAVEKERKSVSLLDAWRARIRSGELGLIPVLIGLAVIWLVFQSINGHFLSSRNLSNLVLQIATIGMLGVGETFILLLGEIDLSIAAVSGVAAGVLVQLSVAGVSAWLAILAAVLTGAVIGLFQGWWVTYVGVPSFIVTLAGSLGYQGILLAMLGQEGTVPISDKFLLSIESSYLPAWLSWVLAAAVVAGVAWNVSRTRQDRFSRGLDAASGASIGMRIALTAIVAAIVVLVMDSYRGVPVMGLILLVFVVFFGFVLQSTQFGRHVYALGGNAEASRRAGIPVRTIRMAVFTLASVMGAIGGILGASRLGSASPASGGGNLLMDSIAAAVIGGTSLFGGRGSVYNALAGALVIGSVENGMDLLSAPSSTKYMIEGGILLIAVTIDTLTRRRRQRAGR